MVSLKLLVDTTTQKVLFAEAGKDFVDFLFHILSLPVATVVKPLLKEDMAGCLWELYRSIENLNETYMMPSQNKDSVLMPKVLYSATEVPLLLPFNGSALSTRVNLYRCQYHGYSNCRDYVTHDPRAICPTCKNVMNTKLQYVEPPAMATQDSPFGKGGYVKGVVTYMVMDDLVVKPMSTISCITLLNSFNINEIGVLEEKVVDVGMDEGVKLLKFSLESKVVLSNVFLGKK